MIQVSHHPPIAATHTHNSKWELWDEKRVSSKFGTLLKIIILKTKKKKNKFNEI